MIPAGVAIAVIDLDQSVRNRLAMQIGKGATTFGSMVEFEGRLTGEPLVAVFGPSCAGGTELTALEHLVSAHREVGAILITDEMSTPLLQQALRAGVKDVLAAPVDTSQLAAAVERVADSLPTNYVGISPPGDEIYAEAGELGQVITVFSTKGGSGKSVIASNLAVALAQRSDRPVVLLDADLQFGDIAVMLKLAPVHTIVDAVSKIEKLDASLLQSLLVTHESSGLLVMPAPLEPSFADQIGAGEMLRIVDLLRTFCSHVVVDTPAYFNDVVLGLVETSDDVLMIAGMDIPNIKNVKIGLQTLQLLNTPMAKLHLVLNRANSKVRLEVSEVERTLGVKAMALIPSDIAVPQSVNKGAPVVMTAPKTGVSKAIQELANQFFTKTEERRKSR